MIRPEDDPALLKAYHDVVTSNSWKDRAWIDGSVVRLFILDVARAAIAAEREACAKIADEHEKTVSDQCWLTAKSIAAAIRARGE